MIVKLKMIFNLARKLGEHLNIETFFCRTCEKPEGRGCQKDITKTWKPLTRDQINEIATSALRAYTDAMCGA